jgi:hypothetical protein
MEEEEMGMAYDGPTGATVGALGAVMAYKLSAGSQCGFFWAWLRSTMATRWREGFAATFGFARGWVCEYVVVCAEERRLDLGDGQLSRQRIDRDARLPQRRG